MGSVVLEARQSWLVRHPCTVRMVQRIDLRVQRMDLMIQTSELSPHLRALIFQLLPFRFYPLQLLLHLWEVWFFHGTNCGKGDGCMANKTPIKSHCPQSYHWPCYPCSMKHRGQDVDISAKTDADVRADADASAHGQLELA